MAREEPAPPWHVWIPPVSVSAMQEEEFHVLLWQARGEADIRAGDRESRLTFGHALWVPVGLRHEFTVHANSVTLPLFFPAAEIATTLHEATLVPVDRDLRTLMLAYTVSWNTIIRPDVNLARQILARVERRPALPGGLPMPTSTPARLLAEALRANPGDPRSVAELAASVHVSARTIERTFRAETGTTLRQWRIRHRLEAAAGLLRTSASPAAVARRVGYTNVNAFRRVFKDHFGISPTEFIERYQAT